MKQNTEIMVVGGLATLFFLTLIGWAIYSLIKGAEKRSPPPMSLPTKKSGRDARRNRGGRKYHVDKASARRPYHTGMRPIHMRGELGVS